MERFCSSSGITLNNWSYSVLPMAKELDVTGQTHSFMLFARDTGRTLKNHNLTERNTNSFETNC